MLIGSRLALCESPAGKDACAPRINARASIPFPAPKVKQEEIMPSASEMNEKEPTAEAIQSSDWDRVAAMEEFKKLVAAKRRFIAPAVIFFVVYYFTLPVLVGYAPGLMGKRVLGAL